MLFQTIRLPIMRIHFNINYKTMTEKTFLPTQFQYSYRSKQEAVLMICDVTMYKLMVKERAELYIIEGALCPLHVSDIAFQFYDIHFHVNCPCFCSSFSCIVIQILASGTVN